MKLKLNGVFMRLAFMLIQLLQETLQDNSGCVGGKRSVTVPYITDRTGKFVTHSLTYLHAIGSKTSFVTIPWGRDKLRLVLETHEIAIAESTVEWKDEYNVTNAEQMQTENEGFYQGYVNGRQFSFIALSIKTGLTGYVFFDGIGLFIEPIERSGAYDASFIPHLLHACKRHTPYTKPGSIARTSGKAHSNNRRHRRALPGSYTKYLEVLVVADTTVVNFVGKTKVKSYILGLMNIVNAVYHDSSLGATIEVVTVKIMYMDKASENRVISMSDPKRTVDQFCQWASTNTYRSAYYETGVNHDVAVLLTRSKFAPAGYAPITGLCVPMRNCALVKDDGFSSAFVIAHEIGHVFGLFHDGQGNTCHGRVYSTSIMATMVQSSFHHYWWSGCSKTRMAEVLPGLKCLNNNPYQKEDSSVPLPVGVSWSLDEQCRLEFGQKASLCKIFPHLDPCAQLWCGEGPGTYSCKTKNVVPLDGSQCGPSEHWYCLKGSCGYHGDHAPVHGGWGGWSSWSSCSSGCGIGFKRRSRHCDNPAPEYGGKDCEGEGEDSDTCQAQECTEYVDMRASQCRIMDVVQVREGTHSWKPYQTENADDLCKLTCVSSTSGEVVTFDTLVDNGTPCTYDEPNDICLDGTCVKVGCDGDRNSLMKEDHCGVCGGDGTSCKVVEGVYKKIFQYSAADGYYETVIVLPKGSREITISETHKSPHFLAVRDSVYYQYVLNGNGKQYPSRNFVIDGAWFKYTNNGGHEKLRSKGPIHDKVNIMIYPMDWQQPASIEFRYTIDKNDFTYETNKYTWRYETWSQCSVSCGKGVQRIIYGCYDKESEEKVDEENCKFIEGPGSEDVECERISCEGLKYRWRMSREWSPCSSSCGTDGAQHQLYDCESVETEKVVEKESCINIPEPIHIRSCNIHSCIEAAYSWVVTSEWSVCSAFCGSTGTQYQLYYCAKENGDGQKVKVEDRFCSDLTDPKEPRPCNRLPCVEYVWILTQEWDECSELCGETGTQQRKVKCQRQIGGDNILMVEDRYCNDFERPQELRNCNRRPCFTYVWEETETWSACSTTCNDGIKIKLILCKNITHDGKTAVVADSYCDSNERPEVSMKCREGPCLMFKWVLTDNWTDCSAECGISGTKSRIQVCHELYEGHTKVVNDTFCSGQKKDDQIQPCNRIPCYSFQWNVGEWTSCPNTCISQNQTSTRTRRVNCIQMYLSGQYEVTESLFCDKATKPTVEETCSVPPCSVYRWNDSGRWSDCSKTCGDSGIQTQVLQCVEDFANGTLIPVDEKFCASSSSAKASVSRKCELSPCEKYSFKASNTTSWDTCSVSCGKGVQQQLLQCVRLTDNGTEELADKSHCVNNNLSLPQRECDMSPCGFLEWGAGEWSMCSKTCGPGQKKRIIYCGNRGSPSDPKRCPGKAPDEYGDCNLGNCTQKDVNNQCNGDKMSFCRHAHPSLCSHPSHNFVCCETCARQSQSQLRPFYRRYYRRYWWQGK